MAETTVNTQNGLQTRKPSLLTLHTSRLWPGLPDRSTAENVDGLPGRALWLGPEEWLVIDEATPSAALPDWQAKVQAEDWLLDVSEAYSVWSLNGPDWRARLSGFVPHDLNAGHFPAGHVIRSRLHSVPVIVEARPDDELWLLVPRSYGRYVEELLLKP
jgi:sarcosine oxidase, subunit gamma